MNMYAPGVTVCLLTISGAALAQDAAKGKMLFGQCGVCHATSSQAAPKMGPPLASVVGRKAGTAPGYHYSPAMAAAGLTWDQQTLQRFLERPQGVVSGTKMTFPGVPTAQDRLDIIAYLATLK